MSKLMPLLIFLFSIQAFQLNDSANEAHQTDPVTIGVAGLTHGHVHWIFGRGNIDDIEIVGIYEPNETVWQQYQEWYDLDSSLWYKDLDKMLEVTHPEAVTAFGSTYDHLAVVEAAAPREIHIMVEKPLAVNMEHASRMKELAELHDVHLITNYETTWYASNHELKRMFENSDDFGDIRKMVIHDGHPGPKEIGVGDEFLEWLIDPKLNGGGAIMDFGCYGANLMTWLMDGEEPLTVTAVTQTHKPHIYENVDDEATIILTYPGAQGIIQASWNWPYDRKDTHVYGVDGFVYADDDVTLRFAKNQQRNTETRTLEPREYPYDDPFSYFAAVVRGDVIVKDTDLSSLENNITVIKILDAARKSAETGNKIYLD